MQHSDLLGRASSCKRLALSAEALASKAKRVGTVPTHLHLDTEALAICLEAFHPKCEASQKVCDRSQKSCE